MKKSILVSSRCLVAFNFSNNFQLSIWYDVLPMLLVLQLEDYGFFMEGSNMMAMRTLTHLHAAGVRIFLSNKGNSPTQTINIKEILIQFGSLELEELSYTPSKKQFKVTSKKEEIINDEYRM